MTIAHDFARPLTDAERARRNRRDWKIFLLALAFSASAIFVAVLWLNAGAAP